MLDNDSRILIASRELALVGAAQGNTMPRSTSAPTVIDLFAGAGGLGASFEKAGFQAVAAVDAEPDCMETLALNQRLQHRIQDGRAHLEAAKLICSDIRRISRDDLVPESSTRDWRPDVLAGGPPCQPFSHAGLGLSLQDPRGQLFRQFVRLADELNPKIVLFENVAGLVTSKCAEGIPGGALMAVQRAFEQIGFACSFQLLNAADFGGPQRRVRLYMLASRDFALPAFPAPTHSALPGSLKLPWVSLGDCISKLPPATEADVVTPSGKRAGELHQLKPGTGLKSHGLIEANRPSGHWGYRQDCFVADTALPSRTIRAASTPDWVRVDNHGLRRLTWRECAALQAFPLSWEFVGTKASRFRQIGNAVQGHIGRAVATSVFDALASAKRQSSFSDPWPENFHKRVRYTAMEARVNGSLREEAGSKRIERSGELIGA